MPSLDSHLTNSERRLELQVVELGRSTLPVRFSFLICKVGRVRNRNKIYQMKLMPLKPSEQCPAQQFNIYKVIILIFELNF